MEANNHLLEIRNLTKIFHGGLLSHNKVVAVDNVSLTLPTENPSTVTIAGESGSGKTTLAQMVLGFLKPSSGKIIFGGHDIKNMGRSEFKNYRREVQAIFQDPYEAFNPFYKIDHVFELPISKFKLAKGKSETRRIISKALEVVRLDADEILGKYPHQLSGGQLQRVLVGRAFLLKPRLIVADEPVSMLDVSLRAIILDIMMSLKNQFGISQLYITHDLSTALQISDEIIILYQGSVSEQGDAETVIRNPQHPYTQLLINSIPVPDPDQKWEGNLELDINDESTSVVHDGCKFYMRCPRRMNVCLEAQPPLYRISEKQSVACYLYQDDEMNE